ncbi:hypothetical protein F2P81_010707 [Scophthalmus maximus]|uniref:Secreted protein n=1 Tax=Scophthalmus maximus TaxID=52904 RepID=A0A6A4SV53_SCOMX|nr:hypothetical protein F2P81_010707 [Scophthalmus maximus]
MLFVLLFVLLYLGKQMLAAAVPPLVRRCSDFNVDGYIDLDFDTTCNHCQFVLGQTPHNIRVKGRVKKRPDVTRCGLTVVFR